MHPTRKTLWIVSSLLSALVIVAILAALIARIPSTSQQLPPNTAPLLVVLDHPVDGSTWPVDTPVPVTVMVTAGTVIKSVQFWSDGRLFDTQAPSGRLPMYYKVWSWVPLTEGAHVLFVRATDAIGRTADSNAVHIQASAAAGLIAVLTAKGGETLQSLASQNGLTPQQIAAVNPSLNPTGTVAPGTQVFIPTEPFSLPPAGGNAAPPTPAGPVVPAVQGMRSGPSFYLQHALNPNPNTPTPPGLGASLGVCDVTLTIQDNSDNEDGFFVYALPESSVSFKRITSLQAHTGSGSLSYTIQNQHGHVEFYVSAYNTSGESASAPASVDVSSPQCNPSPADTGGLKYQGGFLTMPDNIQLAYFYASVNGDVWQRVPADHQFLQPSAGQVDLRPQIKQLLGQQSTGEADLDVWGWKQEQLVHVGQIHISINFASLAICDLSDCNGDMGSTHWVTQAVVGSDQADTLRNFTWSAPGADITYAIWQVSTQPFPPEYSVGAPPGLLLSGISDAAVNTGSGVAAGTFQVDFKTDLQYQNTATGPIQIARTFNFNSQLPGDFNNDLLPGLAAGWQHPLGAGILQALETRQLYVRAMPMAGGHPASDPSNIVQVTYQPTGPQPTVTIYKVPTYSVQVVPGSYVNEVKVVQQMGILGCSSITGVDHDTYVAWFKQAFAIVYPGDSMPPAAEKSEQYWVDHIGWTLCPGVVELPDDTVWGFIGQAFENLFNTLSSTLETIKGTLVSALASIIPGCDQKCSALLMTGLNFTITYFTGLPPSLPNFDQAVSMGINYAVQIAIAQSGIPYCDADCQGKISDQIKSAAEEVANSGRSQPGCQSQDYTLWLYQGSQLYHLKPLCIPPGIAYQPLKGSMYEKAMVQVKVSRIDGSPQPAPMENLVVDTQALNQAFADGHTESDYYMITTQNCDYWGGGQHCTPLTTTTYYTIVYNLPLKGTPFPTKSIPVPALKAFQSIVIPVVFDSSSYDYTFPNIYWPRAFAIKKANPAADLSTVPVDWWRDFLHLTDSGSQITISAKVLCQDQSTPNAWNSPCSDVNAAQFIVP